MAGRWGITIPLEGLPMREHREPLQEAEAAGYTDVWSAEVNANDAFVPLAAVATWTNQRLGTAIAGIYTRTPTLIAQSAAAMEDLAPGRFCLGLGTSSPAIVENWNGVRLERPLERMRQTIAFVKQALTGEKAVAANQWFDVKGFRLGRAPSAPTPVFVGALREKMLRLGGEMAEGVITNYIAPEDARRVASVAKDAARQAGKDPEKLDIACRIFVIATEDAQVAQMAGRFIVSGYLTTPFYYAFHEWLGRGEQLAPMMKAWRAGDRQGAMGLVPPQVVDDLFVFGSPQQCREKIEAYCQNGITTPILNIIPTARDPQGQREQSLKWLRDLAPR
ncbi:MAG: LLM class F420-dependent oxidoreductase [Dehalococcoidia bacterium]|nr:LLM class F420-dependent oxidoreductase [Dehalococcoidia bacterium]